LRDRAAEGSVCLDEELFNIFRHEPVFFALLPVGIEFGHVDVAGTERLVLHVSPDAGDLPFVGLEIDLGEDLRHVATA
jgi:hypothetical protein